MNDNLNNISLNNSDRNIKNQYDVSDDYYVKLALKQWGNCKPTKVAYEYFSVNNIKRIQKKIKKRVYELSYSKFILQEDQNVLDLLQVMIVIYLEHSKNIPLKIVQQVKHLNELTVKYIVPDMITNLKQMYGYLSDIKNPINPIMQPINVNNAGRLQLKGSAQILGI